MGRNRSRSPAVAETQKRKGKREMRHIGQIAAELRRAKTDTKKAITETLRGADGLRAKQAGEMVEAVLAEMKRHQQAIADRHNRRFGKATWAQKLRKAGPLPVWERGTMDDRLLARIRLAFGEPMRCNGGYYRQITRDPAKVGYRVESHEEWEKYGQKHWKRTISSHTVTLPAGYLSRVFRRGLAMVDGIPTLDAAPLDAPEGVELFAAKWAMQGRGCAVLAESGYIARAGRHAYHGETVAKALAGLRRKVAGTQYTAPTMARLAELHGGEWISLATVRAVGACEYGIRSWVERTGMQAQYAAGGATVAEIAAGYAICPAPEARAAVVRGLRTSRKAA